MRERNNCDILRDFLMGGGCVLLPAALYWGICHGILKKFKFGTSWSNILDLSNPVPLALCFFLTVAIIYFSTHAVYALVASCSFRKKLGSSVAASSSHRKNSYLIMLLIVVASVQFMRLIISSCRLSLISIFITTLYRDKAGVNTVLDLSSPQQIDFLYVGNAAAGCFECFCALMPGVVKMINRVRERRGAGERS